MCVAASLRADPCPLMRAHGVQACARPCSAACLASSRASSSASPPHWTVRAKCSVCVCMCVCCVAEQMMRGEEGGGGRRESLNGPLRSAGHQEVGDEAWSPAAGASAQSTARYPVHGRGAPVRPRAPRGALRCDHRRSHAPGESHRSVRPPARPPDSRVCVQVRQKLGLERCRVMITGAAPMPPYLMEFLKVRAAVAIHRACSYTRVLTGGGAPEGWHPPGLRHDGNLRRGCVFPRNVHAGCLSRRRAPTPHPPRAQ